MGNKGALSTAGGRSSQTAAPVPSRLAQNCLQMFRESFPIVPGTGLCLALAILEAAVSKE